MRKDCCAAAVSWAIVVAGIVLDLAQLLRRKDGSKQVWNRLMAGLGRRTGEVRGTAIVSGDFLPHSCIASETPHGRGVCWMCSEHFLVRTGAVWRTQAITQQSKGSASFSKRASLASEA